MKTLIKNLFIFFALFCCQNIFAQSGGVCGYYYNCNNPPFVGPCYCTGDPSASGTITASQYGTMTFHLTATALTYNCCGNPYYGGASVSISSLGGVSSSIGTNTDDVVVACVAPGDTFDWHASGEYGSYNISVSYSDVPAYNDVEPNGSIATATFLAENTTANGNIGHGYYDDDNYDYYRIIAAVEGKITGTANFDGPGYLYLVSKSNGYISSSVTTTGGVVTLSYDCVGKNDTLYWRINDYSSTCSGYTLSYDLVPPAFGSSEVEPNNTIATAMPLAENDTVQGGIGHSYYANDAYDYYRIIAAVEGKITGTANFDGPGYLYLVSKSNGYISSSVTTTGGVVTVSYDCVGKNDTLYWRINDYSSTCSGYTLSYDLEPPAFGSSEVEPNNTIATAMPLAENDTVQGGIGHSYYDDDNYDYYRIIADGGAIVVTASFDKAGHLYLYNKSGSYLSGITATTPETVSLLRTCLAANDTLYARISEYSSTCSGYDISYQHISYVYANDIEPNGGTSTATTLSSGVAKQGQLYSSDTYDYYKIIAGASGFLAVECNFDVAGTIKLYNSNGSAVAVAAGVLPEATTNSSGTAYIYKDCINNGETYYVRVSKLSSACTGYKIIYHIDEENAFVSGNPIPENVYFSSTNLSSNGKVFADSTVTFIAGESIVLQTGFWAKAGSDFHAFIGNCGNNALAVPAEDIVSDSVSERKAENNLKPLKAAAEETTLEIFPNPFSGQASLRYHLPKPGPVEIELMTADGRLVHAMSLGSQAAGLGETVLDAGFLVPGIYIVRLRTAAGQAAKRVVVLN